MSSYRSTCGRIGSVFEPEITAKVAKGGWRVYEVGISYSGRTYAEGKKIGWRDGIHAARCIVRYSSLWDRISGISPGTMLPGLSVAGRLPPDRR